MANVRDVLSRALTDYDFYLSVLATPEQALKPYDLSAEELSAFTRGGTSFWRLISSIDRIGTRPIGGGGLGFDDSPPSDAPPDDSPPSDSPPDDSPPSDSPPDDSPPSDSPPSDSPPGDTPPSDTPPSDTPPSDTPPSDTPPSDTPPSDTPPTDTPPSDTPPTDTPPSDTPPSDTPPPRFGIVTPIGPDGPDGPSPDGPGPGVGVINIGPGGGVGVSPHVGDPPSPGIIGVIHFMPALDPLISPQTAVSRELLRSRAVVGAVRDIRGARSSSQRFAAVQRLMEEIG